MQQKNNVGKIKCEQKDKRVEGAEQGMAKDNWLKNNQTKFHHQFFLEVISNI